MKKLMIGAVILLFLCLCPFGKEQGYAAQMTTDGYVGIDAQYTSLEKGSVVKVNIYSKKEYMGELDAVFEYDKNIFEQVTIDDVDGATYFASGEKLHYLYIEYLSDQDLIEFAWDVKKGLPQNSIIGTVNFKLKKTVDYAEISMNDIWGVYGQELNSDPNMTISTEYHSDDKLTCSIGENNLKIASGTTKGSYGENVKVPLKVVENVAGFCTLGLEVAYDPDVLDYQDVEIIDPYKSKLELKSIYNDKVHKVIRISLVGASNITDTGNFANIVLKIKASPATETAKTTDIGVDVKQATNASGVSVPTKATGSTVSIGISLQVGDVNGDNSINLLDALWILQYYNGIRTLDDASFSRADVNKSNRVDLVDALMIMKHYNGEIKAFQ